MQRPNRFFIALTSILFSCLIFATNEKATKPILIVGGVMCDFFLQLEPTYLNNEQTFGFVQFKEGEKIPLKGFTCYSGGGGLNVAFAIKTLGHETFLVSKIGTDLTGQKLLQEVIDRGINPKFIVADQENCTGTSFILPSANGNNTILMSRGANIHLNKDHELEDIDLKNFAGIYLAPLSGDSMHYGLSLAKAACAHNIPVMFNPSASQIKDQRYMQDILPHVSILLINDAEASLMGACSKKIVKNLEEQRMLAESIIAQGPQICIITNGAKGSLCATKDATYYQSPCTIQPQKSVGAGDTFGGTVFGSILRGDSLLKALAKGTAHSAAVLIEPIPHDGLLSHDELQEKIQTGIVEYAYAIS